MLGKAVTVGIDTLCMAPAMLLVGQITASLEKVEFDKEGTDIQTYMAGINLQKDLCDIICHAQAKATEWEMFDLTAFLLQHSADVILQFSKKSTVKLRELCVCISRDLQAAVGHSGIKHLAALIQADNFPKNNKDILTLLESEAANAMFAGWKAASAFKTSWQDTSRNK